jgi:hypothetical protein
LRDSLASDAVLSELEARPMHATNAATLALFEVACDPSASRKRGAALLDAGYRYLGTTTEGTTARAGKPYDTFIDADDTTYVIVRRHFSPLLLSRYFFITILDDGTCIETFSAEPTVAGEHGKALVARSGHADLLRDAAEHMAHVRKRVERDRKVIPVRTLDDIKRIKRLYISHVSSAETALYVARRRSNANEMARAAAMLLVVLVGLWFAYELLRG